MYFPHFQSPWITLIKSNGRMSRFIIGLIEKVETAFLLTLNIIKGRSRTQSAESNRQISLQSIDSSFIMFDTRVMSKVKMIVGHCRPPLCSTVVAVISGSLLHYRLLSMVLAFSHYQPLSRLVLSCDMGLLVNGKNAFVFKVFQAQVFPKCS